MNILEKLRIIRENRKMSRNDVATHLAVSKSLINEIEAGRSRLSLELFIQLCQLYEVNPLELIKDDDNHYIILTNEDISIIEKSIEILNKINSQAKNDIKIGNNNNIQIGNNINFNKGGK